MFKIIEKNIDYISTYKINLNVYKINRKTLLRKI